MVCVQCQFDNPPGMKFCGECGARLAATCARCGTEAPPGFKFCGECGAPLTGPGATRPAASPPTGTPPVPDSLPPEPTPAETAPESEIKQVTTLGCELLFEGADALDPELTHTLLSRFYELAKEVVERYGGSINQRLERGFLALFGTPVAHEDHARRAVLAAVDLRARLAAEADELERRHGIRWSVRMGLESGTVVVGGSGDMAVGEATTRARRLERRAAPGEILAGDATARMVRAFVELEAVDDADDAGATPAWRVVGRRSSLAPPPSFYEMKLSPFVGRDRELALLEELRARAEQGEGQIVAIAGEAGSGKSRLLHELRKTLRGRPVSYLRGQCLSFGDGIPYLPLADMIRKASRITEIDDDAAVAAKLGASLERIGTDPDTALPYLLRLLGAEEGTETLARLEAQAIQSRTFATMRRVLLDASRKTLVVIELEDVHWLDKTSEQFLDSLVEVMGATRMMLLVTYRSGYPSRWLEKSYATQVTMHRLSADESRRLVDAVLERVEPAREEAPTRRISELLEKAEGNPLFLEELAHAVIAADDAGGPAIPDTVQGILMARVDRLPEGHKRLLRTAAVLGRSFSLELLRAIWDRPEPLEPLLEDLRRRELLYQAPTEDQGQHFFKHALTQEVAYESLLSQRRRELHRRAAGTLERLYADRLEDVHDRLIYHYPRAGEPEKTVHYLSLFAERAARDYAHAEAAKALREALEHAEKLPAEDRDRRSVEVLLRLADSLLPLARFPETLELCERHRERVERLDDPGLGAQYQFWLAHTHTYLGNQEATRRHARLAIAAAEACGDETTEGKASYVLGRNGFWSGQFAEGLESSLRAVVLLERSGEPWWQGQAYWVAGFNHYALGAIGEGIAALERAYEIGEALDDYRLDTSWSLGYFHASLGDWEAGIEKCRRGLERAQDPLNSAVATGFLGYAQLEKGDVDDALATLEDAVERLRETGMQQILGWFTVFLAEARLAAGEVDRARELAEAGLEITREAEFRYGVALALRALGRIELAAGRFDAAGERLDRALASFEELAAPFERARIHFERADLARRRDDADVARRELDESRRLFAKLEVPVWLERVRELSAEAAFPEPAT